MNRLNSALLGGDHPICLGCTCGGGSHTPSPSPADRATLSPVARGVWTGCCRYGNEAGDFQQEVLSQRVNSLKAVLTEGVSGTVTHQVWPAGLVRASEGARRGRRGVGGWGRYGRGGRANGGGGKGTADGVRGRRHLELQTASVEGSWRTERLRVRAPLRWRLPRTLTASGTRRLPAVGELMVSLLARTLHPVLKRRDKVFQGGWKTSSSVPQIQKNSSK